MIKTFKTNWTNTLAHSPTSFYLFLVILCSLLIHIFCMSAGALLVEEAYYWNYAQHLDFSYLDHPPMVALLIKCSTVLFGTNEFSVRMTGLLCWLFTAFFSYKLAELINRGSGLYAVMLLAVLPFFFLQSLVITPDIPLIICWSASLYSLYRALVLNEATYWYMAGFWLGLGMLSKYTISLLGLATLSYVIIVPSARMWFKRKEPYLCALIVTILFIPVIYWNATHEWISLLFQSKRRFATTTSIDLHYLLALLLLFITPLGALGLWKLLQRRAIQQIKIHADAQSFMRIFTLAPLSFFAVFSLNHEINFNWIGPLFLALIPWLATLIAQSKKTRTSWIRTAFSLLFCYGSIIVVASMNTSEKVQQTIFLKALAWEPLIRNFYDIAQKIELKEGKTPVFVPLDNFPIASELAFYQTKLLEKGSITKSYPIVGSHIFGNESLMYRYWSKEADLASKPLILISKEAWRFDLPELTKRIGKQSKLMEVWSSSQGRGVKNIPFYYKIVQLKP